MQLSGDGLVLAATDLSNFLACPHRTALDLAVAKGERQAPAARIDEMLRLLRERGAAHERDYLDHLRALGLSVIVVAAEGTSHERATRTIDALRSGADVIYQGAFIGSGWVGYADFLRKVPNPEGVLSALGDFHYEPYDTKLARETRAETVLQLALYADLLSNVQGYAPERFFVVSPGSPFVVHKHRLADYAAYFRSVRTRMLKHLAKGTDILLAETYPEPVDHCDVCRWWETCNARRRADDHLSFIAGAGRAQREELRAQGASTLAAVAALPRPVAFKPSRGSVDTYSRLVEQAQVQREQRDAGRPVFRVLPVTDGQGLCRLPEPSHGDLFLDLEGARFVREGGHDYLFGLGSAGADGQFRYRAWWAMTAEDERRAFELLIDTIVDARRADPHLHVYHYAPYEPTALKRLAGRYATRQDELDHLLKAECFVDLFAVVRQAVRAGVESYSLKHLEQYCGFSRSTPLREAGAARLVVEMALEAGQFDSILPDTLTGVEGYNRDDVESLKVLREWMEALRADLVNSGIDVTRPGVKPPEEVTTSERSARAAALRARLLADVPLEASDPLHSEHPRWLLAYLIDAHHRDEKAEWWEFFRLRNLPQDELLDEPKALTGLRFVADIEPVIGKNGRRTGSVIRRYSFPPQEVELAVGDRLSRLDEGTFGEIVAVDRVTRTVDVKRGKTSGEDHPTSVFCFDVIGTGRLQESIERVAEQVLAEGLSTPSAAADLLRRHVPRLRHQPFERTDDEALHAFLVRTMLDLDRTVLPIQGPPGAGKTYLAARMIRAAAAAGRRVGVTALSHKVVHHLLEWVRDQAREAGEPIRLARKPKDGEPSCDGIRFVDKDAGLNGLADGSIQVLGGTAWLWADADARSSVDLLFVDEGGQFSLASALAVSPAANSVILLGDPQQLEQPQKGTHPEGVGVSALSHILAGAETMPEGRGIFMPETRRLAPAVCDFTSELFYAGKLRPIPEIEQQCLLDKTGALDGAGLWFLPVEHSGNRSAADEEVDVVEALIDQLLALEWVSENGRRGPVTAGDLRVVAPYNAHVNRLATRLESRGVPVGTVDKFQGQTCAAVIYSMATSDPADAPRGLEFLYSLNRLNVATSRGRCAAFIVASPRLIEPECRTSRQMQLANALCRFVELARRGSPWG